MSTTPPPIDGVETKQAADGGERLSMSLEGEIASSRSSISLSGSAWSIPVDFDASYYESEANVAKIVKIQAFLRRVSVQQHYNLILKLHRKRTRVAREIWNSETTYLEGLLTMYQFFYMPLQKIVKEPNPFITEDQVKLLFGNLQALMDQAKKMNTLLAKIITNYTPHTKIGHIFTSNAEELKAAFTPYVDPFDEANALFLSLRKDNERFREWLQGIEFKAVDLGLESYLIMPIQRVTRYGLLLRELRHQTWQDHPDYEGLNAALQAVEEVASHVNGHKKKVIMQQKIKSIMASIVTLPEIPANEDRLYITEGPVTDLNDSIPVTHHIFLFSDLMIWTQMINKKKFMFRKLNWLKESTAEPVEKSNSFRVITNEWTTTVFTKTKEDQNKWLAYLENENFTPNTAVPQPKRPEVVFLSKQKMVEDALTRGHLKRRNAGSQLRSSTKQGSSGKSGSTKLKKEHTSNGSGGGDEEKSKKDKSRKIPRGYATIDPKTLTEVKAARQSREVGKEAAAVAASAALSSATVHASNNGTSGHSSSASTSSPGKRERAELKKLTKAKKGDTITPEILEALRHTRHLSEAEQQAYLAQLQKEGHNSLPPSIAGMTGGASTAEGGGGSSDAPKSAKTSSRTASTSSSSSATTTTETAEDSQSTRKSLMKAMTVSMSPSSSSSKLWEGPPPPMPDVSHVKRTMVASPSSESTSSTGSAPGSSGGRIRTSTNLSVGAAASMSKPRGASVSVTPTNSRPISLYGSGTFSASPSAASSIADTPESSSSSSTTTTNTTETNTTETNNSNNASTTTAKTTSRPTRQVPVAKRSSTESLTDAAKRRSGSVAVTSKTVI